VRLPPTRLSGTAIGSRSLDRTFCGNEQRLSLRAVHTRSGAYRNNACVGELEAFCNMRGRRQTLIECTPDLIGRSFRHENGTRLSRHHKEAENAGVRVLSLSCPGASGAFLAILAVCKINNLRVINTPEWFKSTPRNQPFQCSSGIHWFPSGSNKGHKHSLLNRSRLRWALDPRISLQFPAFLFCSLLHKVYQTPLQLSLGFHLRCAIHLGGGGDVLCRSKVFTSSSVNPDSFPHALTVCRKLCQPIFGSPALTAAGCT
jgi:hypothetical protein